MLCTGVLVATTDLYNTKYLKTSICVEFEASIGISPRKSVMDADCRDAFPCEPYVAALVNVLMTLSILKHLVFIQTFFFSGLLNPNYPGVEGDASSFNKMVNVKCSMEYMKLKTPE